MLDMEDDVVRSHEVGGGHRLPCLRQMEAAFLLTSSSVARSMFCCHQDLAWGHY